MRASHVSLVAGLAMSMTGFVHAQPTTPTQPPRSGQNTPGNTPGSETSRSDQPDWKRGGQNDKDQNIEHRPGTLNAGDEQGLRERVSSFVMALNQHDASSLSTFLAPDADIVTPAGKYVQGRDSIETMMSQKDAKSKTCKMDLHISSIRGFGEIALVDLDGTVTGMTDGTWWHHQQMGNSDSLGDRANTPGYEPRTPGSSNPSSFAPATSPSSTTPGQPESTDRSRSTNSSGTGTGTDGRKTNSTDNTSNHRNGDRQPGMDGSSMGEGRTFKAHVTLIMKRSGPGGDWMVEAGRPTVLPMMGSSLDRNRDTTRSSSSNSSSPTLPGGSPDASNPPDRTPDGGTPPTSPQNP